MSWEDGRTRKEIQAIAEVRMLQARRQEESRMDFQHLFSRMLIIFIVYGPLSIALFGARYAHADLIATGVFLAGLIVALFVFFPGLREMVASLVARMGGRLFS